jgi:hypothetical protein
MSSLIPCGVNQGLTVSSCGLCVRDCACRFDEQGVKKADAVKELVKEWLRLAGLNAAMTGALVALDRGYVAVVAMGAGAGGGLCLVATRAHKY